MFKMKKLSYSVACLFVLTGCTTYSFQNKPLSHQDFEVKPVTRVTHANENPRTMYVLGRYYQGKVNYAKAIDAYQKALEINPNYVEVHNNLGIIYTTQGNHELAYQHFQQALALSPQESYLHNNQGYAYLIQGRDADAANSLRQALRFDVDNNRARTNLAIAFDRLGLHDEAQMLRLVRNSHQEHEAVYNKEHHHMNDQQIVKYQHQEATIDLLASSTDSTDNNKKSESRLHQVAPGVWNYQSYPNDPNITLLTDRAQKQEFALNEISPGIWKFRAAPQDPIISALATEINKAINHTQNLPHEITLTNIANVHIEISNGNGVNGMAKNISGYFQAKGFNKPRLTNHQDFHKSQTEILYRPAQAELANQINRFMPSQAKITESSNLRHDIQLKIIVGRDYIQQASFFKSNQVAAAHSTQKEN